jgi:hypothetical protein
MKTTRILSFGLCLTASASAQLTPSVDLLSPGEPGYDALPAGLAVVDCFVDLASTDILTIGGTRVETHNTATFVYARDGSGEIILVNPGLHQRYTTFLSRPRGRNAVERFINGGATATGLSTDSTLFDAVWLPPPGGPGGDGYVARIAIDLGDFADRRDFLQLSLAPPDPSATILASCTRPGSPFGWHNATFDVPQFSGINWYLLDPVSDPTIPGDLDGDSDVDIADLAQLLAHFGASGTTYADGDIDGDGDVDLADLAILLGNFGS